MMMLHEENAVFWLEQDVWMLARFVPSGDPTIFNNTKRILTINQLLEWLTSLSSSFD